MDLEQHLDHVYSHAFAFDAPAAAAKIPLILL